MYDHAHVRWSVERHLCVFSGAPLAQGGWQVISPVSVVLEQLTFIWGWICAFFLVPAVAVVVYRVFWSVRRSLGGGSGPLVGLCAKGRTLDSTDGVRWCRQESRFSSDSAPSSSSLTFVSPDIPLLVGSDSFVGAGGEFAGGGASGSWGDSSSSSSCADSSGSDSGCSL